MLCLSFVVSSLVFKVIINLFSAACSKSIVKWDTVPFLSKYKIMCQGIQYFSQVSVLIHLIYFYHCSYISIYDNELLATTLNWDIFCIVAFVFYCSKEEAVYYLLIWVTKIDKDSSTNATAVITIATIKNQTHLIINTPCLLVLIYRVALLVFSHFWWLITKSRLFIDTCWIYCI